MRIYHTREDFHFLLLRLYFPGVCALVTGILLAALKDVVACAFTSDKYVPSSRRTFLVLCFLSLLYFSDSER